MAAKQEAVTPGSVAERSSLWSRAIMLWHLLSLDAPTVAVVWTWAVAAGHHLRLPLHALVAMGVAVWMLYAADRLLDGRGLGYATGLGKASRDAGSSNDGDGEFELRHRFHHQHRRWFRLGIVLASLILAGLLRWMPTSAMRLYLELSAMLAGYFVAIHVVPVGAGLGHRLPKEIAVGVFFAAAVFIPTVARLPAERLRLLPEALLLAAVCSLNCLYIYRWEHPKLQPGAALPVHPATRLALAVLPSLTLVVILAGCGLEACGLMALAHVDCMIPFSCATAAGLLLALDQWGRGLGRTTLRAAADLCLLTPLLCLPWLLGR